MVDTLARAVVTDVPPHIVKRRIEGLEDTLRVLTEARTRVEEGWTQGKMQRRTIKKTGPGYNYCTLGAIHASRPKMRAFSVINATNWVARAAGIKPESIPAWNDCPVTTKHVVLQAFDRAIIDVTLELAETRKLAGLDLALFA